MKSKSILSTAIAAVIVAFTFVVTTPLTGALAGEWISAGNSPAQPHWPAAPANYTCQYTLVSQFEGKKYRVDREREFFDKDFRSSNVARHDFVINGEADPLMNGHSISLSFQKEGAHKEIVLLALKVKMEEVSQSISTEVRSSEAGLHQSHSVSGLVRHGDQSQTKWVELHATCSYH